MRYDSLNLLTPSARAKFEPLAVALANTSPFLVFESYRDPEQQDLAFRRGVSKARAFESAHQFGLAVDFVPFIDGGWTWQPEDNRLWLHLSELASSFGLSTPLAWDRPHVEDPTWQRVRKLVRA